MIAMLGRRINPSCELIAQVQVGYYVVDVYSWGNVVAGKLGQGTVLDVKDGACQDRLLRSWPPGAPEQSRRLAAEIIEARRRTVT